MNILVTHHSPDLDAASSCWLIRKYYTGWKNAQLDFVSSGQTLNNQDPDEKPNIIHVDTGMGKFDHHQTSKRTSAAELVFNTLRKENMIPASDIPALRRMIKVIVAIDHFEEIFLPDPSLDIHDFSLYALMDSGLKDRLRSDEKIIDFAEKALDALLINMKRKIQAEKIITTGTSLKTKWGRTLILETDNEECMKLAMKKGFDMVIRRSKKFSYIRIKLHPKVKFLLKKLYPLIKKSDPHATWFYHSSGRMLLNGSSKTPDSIPSSLSLEEVVKIVKSVK